MADVARPGVVLLADDEPAVRAVVAATLGFRGLRVLEAANGAEAVELARANRDRIGLILLDVLMPVLDGPRALAAIRGNDPAARCWFMTGYLAGYDETDLLGLGAVGVLRKPFGPADLDAVLAAEGLYPEPTAR